MARAEVNPQGGNLFDVATPLGFSVRTTVDYWSLIETKHPKLRGRVQAVIQVLSAPGRICCSLHDTGIYICGVNAPDADPRLTGEQKAERAAMSREEKIRRQENTNID